MQKLSKYMALFQELQAAYQYAENVNLATKSRLAYKSYGRGSQLADTGVPEVGADKLFDDDLKLMFWVWSLSGLFFSFLGIRLFINFEFFTIILGIMFLMVGGFFYLKFFNFCTSMVQQSSSLLSNVHLDLLKTLLEKNVDILGHLDRVEFLTYGEVALLIVDLRQKLKEKESSRAL